MLFHLREEAVEDLTSALQRLLALRGCLIRVAHPSEQHGTVQVAVEALVEVERGVDVRVRCRSQGSVACFMKRLRERDEVIG